MPSLVDVAIFEFLNVRRNIFKGKMQGWPKVRVCLVSVTAQENIISL